MIVEAGLLRKAARARRYYADEPAQVEEGAGNEVLEREGEQA